MDTIKGVACTIHCKCQHCGKQNSIDQCFVEVSSYKLAVIHHEYDGEFTKETPYLSIKVGGVETIPVPAGWKTIDDCGCTETVSEFTQTLLKFHEWLVKRERGFLCGGHPGRIEIIATIKRLAQEFSSTRENTTSDK